MDIDRLADVVKELTTALQRLNSTLDRFETEKLHHVEVVEKLTDERFGSVTRG